MSGASIPMWRRHLALLILMLCAIPLVSLRAQESAGIAGLGHWLRAVERHVPGEIDESAIVVASWYRRDLASLFPYIRAYFDVLRLGPAAARKTLSTEEMVAVRTIAVASPGQRNPLGFAKRAATLHADIAMFGIDRSPAVMAYRKRGMVRRPPDASIPERTYATGVDGQYQGDGESEGHWDAGRTILDFVRPETPDPQILLWYRAGAATMMAHGNYVEALPHLRHALSIFPADAQLLFSSGCLYEVLASRRIQSMVRRVQAAGGQVAVENEEGNLDRAGQWYRRALQSDRNFTEARIRLGRVLGEGGKPKEAVSLLRVRTTETDPALLAYYRALFLGDVEDAIGDLPAAEAAYREASRLFPRAQSPRLSLALLAVRTGERQTLSSVLAPLREKDSGVSTADDPWWSYGLCTGRDAESLAKELRREIGELAR